MGARVGWIEDADLVLLEGPDGFFELLCWGWWWWEGLDLLVYCAYVSMSR